jgi:glycerol-1-phosphate dehydrogenase [NAD(P)+]
MEDLFAGLDAPINPVQIDVSLDELYQSVIYAKEVRPRYTVLQLIWDLGLSKEYAEKTREYFSA